MGVVRLDDEMRLKMREFISSYGESVCNKIDKISIRGLKDHDLLFESYNGGVGDFVKRYVENKTERSKKTLFGQVYEKVANLVASHNFKVSLKPKNLKADMVLYDEVNHRVYLVEIKSGPKWGNSSSGPEVIKRLTDSSDEIAVDNPGWWRGQEEPEKIKIVLECNGGSSPSILNPKHVKLVGSDKTYELQGRAAWYFLTGNPNFMFELAEFLEEERKKVEPIFNERCKEAEIRMMKEIKDKVMSTTGGDPSWVDLIKWAADNMPKFLNTTVEKKGMKILEYLVGKHALDNYYYPPEKENE